MRSGLPFDVNEQTRLATDWLQVCQRVSQSENGLARWEVVGATTRPGVAGQARDRAPACADSAQGRSIRAEPWGVHHERAGYGRGRIRWLSRGETTGSPRATRSGCTTTWCSATEPPYRRAG